MIQCNTVFMGSPEFAVPTLQKLTQLVSVVGVITQPDRPAGRGKTLTPPPVKQTALELNIPIMQPERLRSHEAFAALQSWAPDLIVVAAFGQILRQNVLDLPRFGCINVHASLLPRWRGAAPIQAALLNGDVQTGVTIMKMDPGIDTGPMLTQQALPIFPEDNAGSLAQRLSLLGAELLEDTLPGYLQGEIEPQSQDETWATYAPMLKKEHGQLDFNKPATALVNQIRAFNPWPGAFMTYRGEILKIHQARAEVGDHQVIGQRGNSDHFPAVACGDGILVLETVQPSGKKPMPGDVFLRGARDWVEARL